MRDDVAVRSGRPAGDPGTHLVVRPVRGTARDLVLASVPAGGASAGPADLRRPGSRPQAGTEGRRVTFDSDPFGDERDDEAVSA